VDLQADSRGRHWSVHYRILFVATVSLVDDYHTCFLFMRTSSLMYVTTRSLAIKAASFSSLFVSSARPTALLRLSRLFNNNISS
jgi:hypothetical protein